MAIVNYNSLAVLYNIRQKFEICPTQDALWFCSSFLTIGLKTIWTERLFLFDFNFWNLVFQFWSFTFFFFPHIPQTAVDMKWCPCVKELVKKSCQSVSILMPTAKKWCQPKVRFHEKLKQKLIILFLQQFNSVRYTVSTPMLETEQSASGRKSCLWHIQSRDSETNSGGIHSLQGLGVSLGGVWPHSSRGCEGTYCSRYLQ